MRRFMILSGLLSAISVHVIYQVNVMPGVWIPKQYPEMRKAHAPKDDYWWSIDSATFLSPGSARTTKADKYLALRHRQFSAYGKTNDHHTWPYRMGAG